MPMVVALLRGAAVLASVTAAAMLLQAAMLAAAGRPQPVLVLSLQPLLPAGLPAGASLLGWDEHAVRLGDADAAAVRSLYARGAILVLPLRAGGCLSLRRAG